MNRSNLMVGVGACLGSAALFAVSYGYRNLGGGQGDPGAIFLPRLVLGMIFGVGLWSCLTAFLPARELAAAPDAAGLADDDIVPGITLKAIVAALATAVYLICFSMSLYFWATPVYLAFTLCLAGVRDLRTIVLVAGGFTLVAYLGFYLLLDVPLLSV